MFKRIILFIINFLSKLVYKDKFILCENNESPYRSNALVKTIDITLNNKVKTLDMIITNDTQKCPAYYAHSLVSRKQCSPLRRINIKNSFFRKQVCPIDGLHIHCTCDECGCKWIVFREAVIKSFEYK